MKKNDWNLLISVALYSFLFYQQSPGINFLIFNVVLIFFLILRDTTLLKNIHWLAAAGASVITSVSITLYGNWYAFAANFVSLMLLSAYSISKEASVFMALLYAGFSYVTSIPFIIIDIIEKKLPESHDKKSSFGMKFLYAIIIIAFVILFFLLYRASNPLFKDFTKYIKLDFITWKWAGFTFLGFLLLYGFYFHKNIPFLHQKDMNAKDDLDEEKINALPEKKGFFDLETENKLGKVLFVLLNFLIFIVNILDFLYLWINKKLPEGMTYAESVHQGIGAIIVSIIIAILIILYLFRGKLNFFAENKTIKILATIWIIQNVIMIFSTCYRNVLYVNEYSLTYKRIGVFFYLSLAIIGLITTFIKVNYKKSTWFLFRKNGWAVIVLLVLTSLINWDMFITKYNFKQFEKKPTKKLDRTYLLGLSYANIHVLLNNLDTAADKNRYNDWSDEENYVATYEKSFTRYYYNYSYLNKVHIKMFKFLEDYNEESWRSWSWYKHKVFQKILDIEKAKKLTSLDLSGGDITNLSPIKTFSNLQKLNVKSNRLSDLSFLENFKELYYLDASINAIQYLKDINKHPNLKVLYLSSNQLTNVAELKQFPNLEELNVSNNYNIDLYSLPKLPNLYKIDVSNITINDFKFLKNFPKLTHLEVTNMPNKINIELPAMPHLKHLNLSSNNIKPEDKKFFDVIATYNNIEYLDLSNNPIENLMVLVIIKDKDKTSTKVEYIPCFPKLHTLNVSYCNIKDVQPLVLFPNLKTVYLNGNQLEKIDRIAPLKQLENLYLNHCELNKIFDIATLDKLKELQLNNNKIDEIIVSKNMNSLEKLSVANNQLSDLSFVAKLANLEVLNLAGNRIKDISQLTELKKLKILDLRTNSISDYRSLKDLPQLEVVYVSYMLDEEYDKLKKLLPNTKIIRNQYAYY